MATYNIRLMDGAYFTDVADNVMFQMLEQLNVRDVASRETGEILYQSKAAKEEERISHMSLAEMLESEGSELVVRVRDILHASVTHGIKQYENAVLIPIPDENNWYTVAIVDMYDDVAVYRFNDHDEAEKRFKSTLGKSWFSATMWANNTAIFKCKEGESIWR